MIDGHSVQGLDIPSVVSRIKVPPSPHLSTIGAHTNGAVVDSVSIEEETLACCSVLTS